MLSQESWDADRILILGQLQRGVFPLSRVVILMSVSANACSAPERYSSSTIRYDLAAFG